MAAVPPVELTTATRDPEPLTITLLSARNLRGSKADQLTTVARVEFNGSSLGESGKFESTNDTSADYNFSASYNCIFDDSGQCLDDIAHKPAIVTIVEILPKEKKQKEEKSNLLGQCTLDLVPLLQEGVTKYETTLIVNPIPGSALDNLPPEIPKPEIDICISVVNALISDEESNVIAITVESLFAPPDSWSPSHTQYTYTATLPMPVPVSQPGEDKDVQLSFPLGVLRPAGEKEVNHQKRWVNPGAAQGASQYMPEKFVPELGSVHDIEKEDGDFRDKQDVESRVETETGKNRVLWNYERRCFLNPESVSRVQTQVATARYWPLEIWRVQQAKEVKGKKEDDMQHSFHGIVYVNMAKLLYPGVKRIRGAFRVCPYNEAEAWEKTKRKSRQTERPGSGRDDGGTTEGGKKPATGTRDPPGTGEKEGRGKKEGGKSRPGKEEEEGVDLEGQQYSDAGSFVTVEVSLVRPLVPKKELDYLRKKVAEYIPPRPRFPLRTDGAERAVHEYHNQVVSVVNLILEQYRDLFAEELLAGNREQTAEGMKQRYQALIYELNTSGKYFAFREQLKHSVIKIVREKYLRTSSFESQADMQRFLSELYVFLVDEMHKGLARVLTLEDQTPVPEPLTSTDQLKHFAREAEVNNDTALAEKYYLERIARNKKDANTWLDYASFALLNKDLPKAIECTRECVAIDQTHLKGLLLYGILMFLDERWEVAKDFLEAATNFFPESVEAWSVLGLYYDATGNEIGYEMAIGEANRANLQHAVDQQNQQLAAAAEKSAATIESKCNELLDPSSAAQDPAPAQDPSLSLEAPGAPGSAAKRAPTRTGSAEKSSASLNQPSRESKGNKKGKDASRNPTPGKDHTEEPEDPPRPKTPTPERSVFMLAAQFLLDLNALKLADRALAHELTSCALTAAKDAPDQPQAAAAAASPSFEYHVALARLNLQTGNLMQADKAIQTAITKDFKNAECWSLDGHIHFMKGETEEARVSYERVLSYASGGLDGPDMHAILLRLAGIYLQQHRYEEAKCTYLVACRDSPSSVAWQGVGIASYRLGQLAEAEDALCEANILNNSDPVAWGYLSLVCLQTGRQFESEQSYKYSLKVGLDDKSLIDEIHSLQNLVGFGNPSF